MPIIKEEEGNDVPFDTNTERLQRLASSALIMLATPVANHVLPTIGNMADGNHHMASVPPIAGHLQLGQEAVTDSPQAAAESEADSHKRTYQACIACRQRKVKCDRGPVDTPIDGPCRRCKREKKECLFSATRKKRKRPDDNTSPDEGLDENYVRRNARDVHAHGTLPHYSGSPYATTPPVAPRSALIGQPNATQRPSRLELTSIQRPSSASHSLTNETAAELLMSPINNPGEALHLLVDAAKRSEDMERQQGHKAGRHASGTDNKITIEATRNHSSPIDPAITTGTREPQTDAERVVIQAALQAWSRLRFVHAGWITSKEGMDYVDYYYRFLAPLTPISIPDFSSPASQPKFLSEEPMLVVTVLTIASRFKKLEGAAGESRSFLVHEKLWTYLQGMITRMFWGQEQFGGGFCGAGSSVVAGLRGLGTVESLLLLSDWHPRSMHFPPGDDGNEILLPLPKDENEIRVALTQKNSVGWAEPAMRSDRMSWSLIGCAYTLAFELGVFDCLATQDMWEPRQDPAFERSNRVGRLVYIYVGLITGKLGYPNMLPQPVRVAHGSAYLKMVTGDDIARGQASDDVQGNVQRAWAEITSLMRATNEEMFTTPARIAEIVHTRSYFALLQKYKPILEAWLNRFHKLQIPPQARIVLLMEYEYMRAFCNSLALQAVLDECAADTSGPSNARSVSPTLANAGNTPPALLSSRLVDFMRINAPFINEVTDASRRLLQHAVKGLSGPTLLLKHVSTRTYFRILSCAMFLLKTFALGGKSDDVEISLQLLKSTIDALRKAVVDDVHLCNRIADLLEYVSRIIAYKFVVIKVPGSIGGPHSVGHSLLGHRSAQSSNQNTTSPNQQLHHHRPSNSQSRGSFAAPGRSSSSRFQPSLVGLNEDLYSGPLAGIAVNAIDPNDARFSIMPPPDFIFPGMNAQQNGGARDDTEMSDYTYPAPTQDPVNNSIYTQLQAAAATDARYARPSNANYQGGSPETSFSSPPSHTSNPNAGSNVNGGAGAGYRWMTLDLQNYGNPQPQHALQTRGPLAFGGAMNSAGSYGGDGNDGWGAFGPELSGSLETLGLLGEGFPGMGMGMGVGLGMGAGRDGLDGGMWDNGALGGGGGGGGMA